MGTGAGVWGAGGNGERGAGETPFIRLVLPDFIELCEDTLWEDMLFARAASIDLWRRSEKKKKKIINFISLFN